MDHEDGVGERAQIGPGEAVVDMEIERQTTLGEERKGRFGHLEALIGRFAPHRHFRKARFAPTWRAPGAIADNPCVATLRLALCQLDPTVGDIAGNEAAIAASIVAAREKGAGLVLFGELSVTGYPPEDLLYKEHFLRDARAAIERLAVQTQGLIAIVGFPERADDVYNAAAVLADGRLVAIYRKMRLPNYGVFDEQRYFRAGTAGGLIELGEHTIGITVCEDIWQPGPPCSDLTLAGATLIVNVSASPYHAGKGIERELMVIQRSREHIAAFAFCALVGGQDELVFDGNSLVVDHTGAVIARAAQFEEEILICDVDLSAPAAERRRNSGQRALLAEGRPAVELLASLPLPPPPASAVPARIAPLLEPVEAEVYAALCLGLRDYLAKNGFNHVVLGLSGGIDSALVAAIAVDALGAERVSVIVMPSQFSSEATQGDARALAATLGVQLIELPIAGVFAAYESDLAEQFAGLPPSLAEENLQARIRGNLLMALSNKFGWLVLTTGNKSEMSVGYSTLYGDSAGGFAVIKDLEKTLVYRLARWRNEDGGPIPASIIERPPSAELRPDQRDDQSLPPYDTLDAILRGYVEEDLGREELIATGLPAAAVDQVIALVDTAEYKRRQAPPGIKVTERAFGRDRRMPITNRYRG
jgi:NAD+ synthase (glutamine-hydrolysing)